MDDSDERLLLNNGAAVPQLIINPAQPSDSGDYSCSAQNSVGESKSANTFHLEVICKKLAVYNVVIILHF